MNKLAFVFPGQGSQFVGMGKDLYDHFPEAKRVYDEADAILGFPISEVCFNGPEDLLKQTANTQPALYITSVAALRVLEANNIKPQIVAGHSIGEYAALTAAHAIEFADGVSLVRKRGELMEKASMDKPGTMAAILGLNAEIVRKVCEEASRVGVVEIANYNSSSQIVISGEVEAVKLATQLAKEAGAKKVVSLSVSGPFHSSLMSSASKALAEELAKIKISDPVIPVIANTTADYVMDAEHIRESLAMQISGSVHWAQTMDRMAADGVNRIVEVGPGKVLIGLFKRAIPDAALYSAGDVESIQNAIEALKI